MSRRPALRCCAETAMP